MEANKKIISVIDALIELAENNGYEEAQIGGLLRNALNWQELKELGYEKYIRAYFEEE